MEPDRRLVCIGLLPGIPGINRLGFARHEAPIVRADSLVMEITQHGIESAALGTGHVFGAEQRTMILPQRFHTLPHIVWRTIAVEGDDVRFVQLQSGHRTSSPSTAMVRQTM